MKYGLQKRIEMVLSEIYALSDYILEDDKSSGKKLEMMPHIIKII